MNLFFLDSNLDECAKAHVDRHVVKMITEANQLLATCYPKGVAPYRHSHFNHPMAKWVRSSIANFDWTIQYADALCKEYTFRYGKIHKGEGILSWYKQNAPIINSAAFTEPPRCFSTFQSQIPVTTSVWEDYRQYYRLAKQHIFKWKNRPKPIWLLTSEEKPVNIAI